MKITVLGCGAIGRLWMLALHQQGHAIQGWLRLPRPDCTVQLTALDGRTLQQRFPANDPEHLADSHLLLVTLKAWQVAGALGPLLPQLPPHCAVLLLHNGMGTLDELPATAVPLLQGITTHAARHEGSTIIHVAQGVTRIGPATPAAAQCETLTAPLHQALPDVVWQDNIAAACWHKLAINCVINPLTAIYHCRNGELQRYPEQIARLCAEIAQVMTREGQAASTDSLQESVYQVIQSTADNISSMLHDMRTQQPSEIDYITGYLLRRARFHGLDLPENTRLFEQIKQKENAYESIGTGLPRTRQ